LGLVPPRIPIELFLGPNDRIDRRGQELGLRRVFGRLGKNLGKFVGASRTPGIERPFAPELLILDAGIAELGRTTSRQTLLVRLEKRTQLSLERVLEVRQCH
jgi:hypothetical protein